MIKVAFAYRCDGHEPDDVVAMDDETAKTLIRDGKARHANETDLERELRNLGTVAELREYADVNNIDLGGATRKAEIEAAIADAVHASESSVEPDPEPSDDGAETTPEES